MDVTPCFDPAMLRRYERPGPRYTSYPTAPQFDTSFGVADLVRHAQRSNASRAPLSIYLHVPYCTSPCFYCGCNRVITRDRARGARYLERLVHEIDLLAPLFSRDREVVQVHFGGGTPNFLRPAQLGRVLEQLDRSFQFSTADTRDFSIELDPREITPREVGELAALGINRASLGVQDFNPDVQRAVNRVQSVGQTLEVIDACRAHGLRSVNVDLIYGLPRQTLDGFRKTLETVIDARPDRLAIYGYAHMPSLFKGQTQIRQEELPDAEGRLALLHMAVDALTTAGYVYIGMDHFALPDDDLAHAQADGSLQRNFMGYTTHADCDLLGLGVSAISHIGDSFSQNPRDVPAWEAALDQGRIPVWRGMTLSADDKLRARVIAELMCQGRIDIPAVERSYQINFWEYFCDTRAALRQLAADGLLTVADTCIEATPRGRYLLRIIAMRFDHYLNNPKDTDARYSKAI